MNTIIKLGGSLITDKNVERSYKVSIVERLGQEIYEAYQQTPDLRLVMGHGSGSFGHFSAKRHNTINGVSSNDQWIGFAEVASVASELNHLVTHTLRQANLPILRIQPSASAIANNGVITQMSLTQVNQALDHRLIPLLYGDVALDIARGGTIISTETILAYLCQNMPVKQVFLLGEVAGVLDSHGKVIPHITPDNIEQYQSALQGSSGTDVTGGMLSKVGDMLKIAQSQPNLTIHIIDGRQSGILFEALTGNLSSGTRITG
jgi:isopentenyl phosphate kinase